MNENTWTPAERYNGQWSANLASLAACGHESDAATFFHDSAVALEALRSLVASERRRAMRTVVEQCDGNRSEAARVLRVSRNHIGRTLSD